MEQYQYMHLYQHQQQHTAASQHDLGPLQYHSGVVEISWAGLGLAASLILVQCTVSARLGLGLHAQLLTAGVRCVIQLSLLGHILVPIFNYGQLWLVLAYAAFMVCISAVEAIGRPARYYKGMFSNTLLIIGMCASSILIYALLLVIGVKPWWSPQYLIPILGMVLGNAISGISVGLSTVVEELSSGKDQIEHMLAMGASRYEATADLVGRSIRLAMTPLLNTMSVVGLVSIPGMMTGQILSGSDPAQAARYQMVIMFLLGACGSTAAVASVYAAVSHVVDSTHRLRPERLIQRQGKGGVNGVINKAAAKVYQGVKWLLQGAAAVLCCKWLRQRNTERAAAAAAAAGTAVEGGPYSAAATAASTVDLRQPLLASDPPYTCNVVQPGLGQGARQAHDQPAVFKGSGFPALGQPQSGLIGCGTTQGLAASQAGSGNFVVGGSSSTAGSLLRGTSGSSYVVGGSSSSSVRGMSGDLVDVQVVLEPTSSIDSCCDKLEVLSDSDAESP